MSSKMARPSKRPQQGRLFAAVLTAAITLAVPALALLALGGNSGTAQGAHALGTANLQRYNARVQLYFQARSLPTPEQRTAAMTSIRASQQVPPDFSTGVNPLRFVNFQ